MLRSVQALEKYTITATDGDIGQVKDVYFDDHAWVIRYLIVDTGSWLSSRKVLISPMSIQQSEWAAHKLRVAITMEQVKNSPDTDTDQPVSRQHEMEYLRSFGYSNDRDGAGRRGSGMAPFGTGLGYAGVPGGAAERKQAMEEDAKAESRKHHDEDPHLRSGKAVIGYYIQATDGEVGHVDGLLVDEESWAIRYLVVNTSNWWVGHKVLIAPQWIAAVNWSDSSVSVDLSRAAVQAAPPYDPSVELDPQQESNLYMHYGRPPHSQTGSPHDHEL
jgi:uncharacterized protein YrrD